MIGLHLRVAAPRPQIVEATESGWILGGDIDFPDRLSQEVFQLPAELVRDGRSYGAVLASLQPLAGKKPSDLTAAGEMLAHRRRGLIATLNDRLPTSTLGVDDLDAFLAVKTPRQGASFIRKAGILRPGDTVWDQAERQWPPEAETFGQRWDDELDDDRQHHLELLMPFSAFRQEQERLRQLLDLLRQRHVAPLEADAVAQGQGFPSVDAYIRFAFALRMHGGTTLDTDMRQDGTAVLIAHYSLPALYALLWANEGLGHARLCERADCNSLFAVTSRGSKRFCTARCANMEKTRRARRKHA